MAAVITDDGRYFVQVTACASRHRAEELAERLRHAGDPTEVSPL
jgi:cell division septation protein DedD